MTDHPKCLLGSVAAVVGVTLLVGNLMPDVDNHRADPAFSVIRMILFSACIAGAPLILVQYWSCKRTGGLCAGEVMWCGQGFWGVFLIFLSYSNISGFGPFLLFFGAQIITFLLSCALLLAMIFELIADVHRIPWTGWVGTLIGILIPTVYFVALSQADIAI